MVLSFVLTEFCVKCNNRQSNISSILWYFASFKNVTVSSKFIILTQKITGRQGEKCDWEKWVEKERKKWMRETEWCVTMFNVSLFPARLALDRHLRPADWGVNLHSSQGYQLSLAACAPVLKGSSQLVQAQTSCGFQSMSHWSPDTKAQFTFQWPLRSSMEDKHSTGGVQHSCT